MVRRNGHAHQMIFWTKVVVLACSIQQLGLDTAHKYFQSEFGRIHGKELFDPHHRVTVRWYCGINIPDQHWRGGGEGSWPQQIIYLFRVRDQTELSVCTDGHGHFDCHGSEIALM